MATNFFTKLKIRTIIIVALLLRISLAPLVYHGDVEVNFWWGQYFVDWGPKGYYDWLYFGGYARPDQPMFYIIFYGIIRHIYLFFYNIFWFLNIHIPLFPSNFMQWYFLRGNYFLEKVPVIIADLVLIFLVFKFIKKEFNAAKATIAATILALYPPIIYNTAVWGSNDSLLNLLGLTSIYQFYRRRYYSASILFTACVLFKSSLLIFTPIILVIIIKNTINFKNLLKICFPSILIIYFTALPFAPYNPFFWIFNIYTQKILPGAMAQLTSNAINFWSLFYGLKPKLDELLVFPGVTARSISVIICLIFYAYICIKLFRHYSLQNIIYSLAAISLITFTFLTRMHERYSFPALIPLLILCFYDRKIIKYFIALSATHLLNVYNLWWVPQFTFLIHILENDTTIRLLSMVNVLLALKLVNRNVKN